MSLLLFALTMSAAVQDSAPKPVSDSLRLAIPRVTSAPVLDGHLTDAIWKDAAKITSFIQSEPVEESPPTEKSVGYLAYDSNFLYFAFRAYERDSRLVRATLFPREQGGEADDRVTLLIDTFLDKRRAYEFKVTPRGIQGDGIKVEGQRGDPSPDFVWYSAGRVDEEGWVVEVMIPWASLRFPNESPLDIGFNAVRIYGRNGEKDAWAPRRRGSPCDICQEGILTGITGISRRRTSDFLPSISVASTGARKFANDSAAVNGLYFPIARPRGYSTARPVTSVGGDVRVALTSSVVLNATINPDFSQVESDDDQVRVNQRFTLFQQERRPFFLEGKDVFETGRGEDEQRTNLGDLFYSRAIVDPSAGVRLTAKQNAWTVGSLFVRDHSPSYFYYDGYESSGSRSLLNSPANVAIVRARRDVLDDSYVGAGLWSRTIGNARNVVGSGDFSLRRGAFTLTGEGALSADVAPLRPSASSVFDGARRHGRYFRTRLARSGRFLSYSGTISAADSLFRDQLGRFSRVGIEQYAARVESSRYPNNRFLQRVSETFSIRRTNVFGGGILDYAVDPGISLQFQRATSLSTNAHLQRTTVMGIPIRTLGPYTDLRSDAWGRFGIGGTLYFGGREIVDPARPRAGVGVLGIVRVIVRPLDRASVEARVQRSTHADKWGMPLIDDAKIFRLKTTYQFSRELGLRFIGERSDQLNRVAANPLATRAIRNTYSALLSYEIGPSSFFYAGYNQIDQDFDSPTVASTTTLRTDGQLFVKLSYLFRH